jgi:hypothetical protein
MLGLVQERQVELVDVDDLELQRLMHGGRLDEPVRHRQADAPGRVLAITIRSFGCTGATS